MYANSRRQGELDDLNAQVRTLKQRNEDLEIRLRQEKLDEYQRGYRDGVEATAREIDCQDGLSGGVEILEHNPKKRLIERGDKIAVIGDLGRFEVPEKTIFVDREFDVWIYRNGHLSTAGAVEEYGPFVCLAVRGEED